MDGSSDKDRSISYIHVNYVLVQPGAACLLQPMPPIFSLHSLHSLAPSTAILLQCCDAYECPAWHLLCLAPLCGECQLVPFWEASLALIWPLKPYVFVAAYRHALICVGRKAVALLVGCQSPESKCQP